MSSTPAHKSHAAWWCVGVALLVPLLYVLSVPALLRCANVKSHPQDLSYHKKPWWIKDYCIPYIWALKSDTLLKKPLDAYTTLWGYKRNPIITRGEQIMEQVKEAIRKSQEMRVKLDKIREDMEERTKRLPKRPAPTIPIPDSEPAPESRGYESLLRKSS